MPATELPKSAFMAEEFLKSHNVHTYNHDIYEYDKTVGLYQLKTWDWLKSLVHQFVIGILGSRMVSAGYVGQVCESVGHASYLGESLQPPFWIAKNEPAQVIVGANGIIQLDSISHTQTAKLIAHTPDLFAVSGVPYLYDHSAKCPNWMRFLSWMVNDNVGEVNLIQQFCAWVFVAKKLKLERILWLCGPGRNGKSTALNVIRYVIGDSSTSAVGLEAFSGGQNFRLASTLHKVANFSNDSLVRPGSNVSGLNSFVSGDPTTINRKYREPLTVQPTTICFFASNPKPALNDPSDAFWRRLLLICCNQRLDEDQVDPGLIHKLKAEAPGILNWMLAAIPDLLAKQQFDVPSSVRDNVVKLKNEVNSARQFIMEKLELANSDDAIVTRDQFMVPYQSWCELNTLKKENLKVVKEEMQRAFDVEESRRRKGPNNTRVQCWSGIQWKPDEEPVDNSLPARVVKRQKNEIKNLKAEISRLSTRPVTDDAVGNREGVVGNNVGNATSADNSNMIPNDSDDDLSDLIEQLTDDDVATVATGVKGEG